MRTSGQIREESLQNQPHFSERLDSWKQIAVYFDRDVRTVRRWEAERELPVHRLPGERGGVFAYVGELEEWRHKANVGASGEREATAIVVEEIAAEPAMAVETVGWGGWFVRPMAGVFCAVALALISTGWMALRHHARPLGAVAAKHVPLPQAQELDLQGRYFWNLRTEPDLNHAAELFSQAIAHDPSYAPPYAGLADCYLLLRQFGHMTDAEAFPRALAGARQALLLDDSLAAGHRSVGFVLNYWSWDFSGADREFRRAAELDAGSALTHHWYASALWSQGRIEEARRQIDMARALDPQSVAIISNRALFYEGADPKGALQVWQDLERTAPTYSPAHEQLGFRYLLAKDYSGFVREWESLARLRNEVPELHLLEEASRTLERSGPNAMLQQLAAGFAGLADKGGGSAFLAAHFSMLAGDRAGALHFLDLAYSRHDPAVLAASVDGLFAPLVSTREFAALEAKWLPRRNAS